MKLNRRLVTWIAFAAVFGALSFAAVPAAQASPSVLAWHRCFGCGFGWGMGWGWGWGYPYPAYHRVVNRGDWTVVKTDVEPDEAALYLDGKLIGTADDFDGFPDTLYLKPGRYKLEFRLAGFETYGVSIDASPSRSFRLNHRLAKIRGAKRYGTYTPERPPGQIVRYFAKRDDATVPYDRRDDRDRRQYRDRRGNRERPEYRDRDDRDRDEDRREYRDEEREPAPAPEGSVDSEEVEPGAHQGRLVLRVSPQDAAVYVDERFEGTALELSNLGRGVEVSAGSHRITATRPGYREKDLTIEVRDGESKTVEIKLSK